MIFVPVKRTEKTTVIFQVAIDGTKEAIRVDPIAIRLVVLFIV